MLIKLLLMNVAISRLQSVVAQKLKKKKEFFKDSKTKKKTKLIWPSMWLSMRVSKIHENRNETYSQCNSMMITKSLEDTTSPYFHV